ncbi:nucleoside/nucleotide kinase family protein [Actinosynnema sp. ALI-1.44]|uniref:nucleoside/nucleotide kinase family protein n=1 Tax=Actinosynnema sp. ALI-1.44 TaxID=1933779 RepID=UPI00097C75B4|nr:nucleoside/nucleotide kinase family protein [Actinosynnema sp. ALI-1.44]ONI72944.1 nucleoside/nucleotide kinase family protein [Actinosynnema sp. ALI-1.44]
MDFAELVGRARALAAADRAVLGICGAPGAGKSTLAAELVEALGDLAVYVGMDGFHLAQSELARLGRTERKGALDTFDGSGYVNLLKRLRSQGDEVVYAPEFRREIEEPVACAVPVFPRTRLVVTEGNYLLVPDKPWGEVRDLLDEAWFLHLDEGERHRRLIARHEAFGRSPEQARDRALGPDERNASVINATAERADLVLNG